MTEYPLKTPAQIYADNPLTLALTGLVLAWQDGRVGAAKVSDLVAFLADNLPISDAVQAEFDALVGGAPGALDTLNELAAALEDDANFAATITNALAGKQDIATIPLSVAKAPPEMAWVDATTIAIGTGRCRDEDDTINLVNSADFNIDLAGAPVSAHRHVLFGYDADGEPSAVFSETIALPIGWQAYRRIGSIRTNGSGAIIEFYQTGDVFHVQLPNDDISVTTTGSSAEVYALPVATGVKTTVHIRLMAFGVDAYVVVVDADESIQTPTSSGGLSSIYTDGSVHAIEMDVQTNSDGQIAVKTSVASVNIRIATVSWLDRRGRDK